jgi:glutathione peroxidase
VILVASPSSSLDGRALVGRARKGGSLAMGLRVPAFETRVKAWFVCQNEVMRRAVMLALLCTACSTSGGSSEGTPAATETAKPAPPPIVPPKTGEPDPPERYDPTTDPFAPACTGNPGEIYALTVRKLSDTREIPMCRFKGSALLVVNTASFCGYTPQYAPLETIYEKYRDQGFYVLGFPSKTFNQETSNETEISSFCTTTYGITFPMFAIGNVNAPDEQPMYTWLKSQPNMSADVGWNFEKFLVSRDGHVVNRFLTPVTPDDPTVTAAIEAELAKPKPTQ